MIGWRLLKSSLRCLLGLFVLFALLGGSGRLAAGAEPAVRVREIEPPAEWDSPENSAQWMKTSPEEWGRFRAWLSKAADAPSPAAPFLLNAVYRATFDGSQLKDGEFDWQIDRLLPEPGFVSLGQSSLAVSQLKWPTREAVHGTDSTGDWMLWSEADAQRLVGQWSHRGTAKLAAIVFEITLPRALSSRLEIQVPAGWAAHVFGTVGPETLSKGTAEGGLWKFDLGRQRTFQLRLEQQPPVSLPRILLRENTVYGLTTTDDLIRVRTDLDCTVDGARNTDLLFSLPKTLRVFNVLLGNELPLAFERELGSEEDQLRIPLRSLTPGQRLSLRILGESQRRADRSFIVPHLRPVNAMLQEGTIRVAVDRPLEVRSVETTGLRQIQLTEEAGQEIHSYEVLSNACQLSMRVGEPAALLQGEILFIADVRGETPLSRVRARLSTREGELYSPQMLIPDGWELISVAMADASEITPAAWQVSNGPPGDHLLDIELRQPIRPDRDCTLLLEFKAVALPPGAVRRLPIPQLRGAQHCYVRGVVWDQGPWELDELSSGVVELDGTTADEDLIRAVNWTRQEDSQAVPTGVRIPVYDGQVRPLFRMESSTAVDQSSLAGGSPTPKDPLLLCANLELETRTARVGKSHPHRAQFQFSRPASASDFQLTLPVSAVLTRVIADHREVSFVRSDSSVILNPATKPLSELVLEYRTTAAPGWIISRDEVVFPQLDCFVTEFAWHLVLDPERMLYRLPITAAVTRREQARPWERLLGPLARHLGESLFNPLSWADWKSLMNGTVRERATTRENDVWFVAPRIPERITLKTWDLGVSHSLAWCGFLGALVSGIGLRRARHSWFRRGWIYLGGAWLVIAVFVSEPYAPIAGGAFLGSVLAILIPRRFAIGRDWLVQRRQPLRPSATGRAAVITGVLLANGVTLLSPFGIGQETAPLPALMFFEVSENEERSVVFDAAYRPEWNAWHELDAGPAWLLTSSRYEVQNETSGPPRMAATYEVAVFGDPPNARLRLPLSNVSLDQAEGRLDGQPVRLIPSTDHKGFLLPLTPDPSQPPAPPSGEAVITTRRVTLKFRPLPDSSHDEQTHFSVLIPPLPVSDIVLHSDRWRISTGESDSVPLANRPSLEDPIELGPTIQLNLSNRPASIAPRDNLTDVQLRTLLECGPLGAKVQLGVLAAVTDSRSPAEFTLSLPTGLSLQSIKSPSHEQSNVEYLDSEIRVTLRLGPTVERAVSPVEIIAFLPVAATGFQMHPPRWIPDSVTAQRPLSAETTPEARAAQAVVGVVAKPGFTIVDISPRSVVAPISPQAFSDSLFAGMVWQVPDLAWTCREMRGPAWTVSPISSSGRAVLSQVITLQTPQSEWRLDATISTAQGVPFEHLFTIDPRIEIERATVQQDGADRLLRWTRLGDQVHLSIRDGQPGTQTIHIEGVIEQGTTTWAPPVCEFRSGLTTESSVTVRNSARVVSTLKWADSTTRLRPNPGESEEEVRYHPGSSTSPQTFLVEPMAEERSARAWVHLIPQRDSTWQVTVHVQLKASVPFTAPVQIIWDQPGLTDVRLTHRRDNIRQSSNGKEYLWRPQVPSSKPAELSLSAAIDSQMLPSQPILLPKLSGVKWSEIWVSLPRGSGYRPARAGSTLLNEFPPSWPTSWSESFSNSREDLYTCSTPDVPMEATASEPLVRPVLAESVIWLDSPGDPQSAARTGVTKYLLIAERDITLEIPEVWRSLIRAVAVDGRIQAVESSVQVPSRSNDLSHEVIVWWQVAADQTPPDPGELLRVPGAGNFPTWVAVVPPHHQVLLSHWGRGTPLLHEFWLNRSESLLRAALEFKGAPWTVDGPLLHQLAESRDELNQGEILIPAEAARRDQIDMQWKMLSETGGSISSPPAGSVPAVHFSGLDSILSLCGESRSLWLRSPHLTQAWPRLLDRQWAIVITAAVASFVSLIVLTWAVRIFRHFDIAEKLAVRPNATMIGMGLVWWAFLSPSVLGLGLAIVGTGLWFGERVLTQRSEASRSPARPH